MWKTRIISLAAALCCAAAILPAASAAQVESGSVYCFSPEDFGGEDLAGICLTALPRSSEGAVMLGSRALRPGDVLTLDQAAALTFSPARTEEDGSVQVSYLPIGSSGTGPEATMTIGIRGRENLPPVAQDSALETYKNLEAQGNLKASDPEGEEMTFTVTREPRRGSVTVNPDGSFLYTPKHNKVGVDSFVYTAADPAGKTSREATVTITILKPTEAAQYTDTLGRDCRFAAEWMKNTGVFVGETVGDQSCFSPERQVSRGEFVTMLVKALDIPTDEEVVYTGYEDQIPKWLQPYLAAAVRSGITAGLERQETFAPEEPITGAEAAVMLENCLDLTQSAPAMAGSEAPEWAAEALEALAQNGMELGAEEVLTRGQTAQLLYRAHQLRQEQELV